MQYFIKATDQAGDSNQSPIFNYTVLVNRLGNASTLLTNLSNVTVWIARNQTLNATYYGSALVELRWNGFTIVEFTHPFASELLDLRNVTLNASQDNITGWVLVKNLSLPSGTNKTLYLQHLNMSAGFVCVKDAEVSSIDNIGASCAGTNETLVQCNNVSVSGYRCENVSNWWKVTGAAHTAIKEMGNAAPQITATSPSGTVTSSSTTLSATTNEPASCKYSTTQGQAYSAMLSSFTGTGTSHTASLTGLSNGAYTYYALCQDSNGGNSSESTITFTVSITISSGGGGGGGVAPTTAGKKELTFSNPQADREHVMHVSQTDLATTKLGFVNTKRVSEAVFTVQLVNDSVIEEPLDTSYQYMNITLEGLQQADLSSAWVEFRVNTSWISGHSAARDDVRLKRYRSGLWQELPTEWVKDIESYSYFNATTPGFSIFAIALAAKEPEPEPEGNVTIKPELNVTGSVEPEINETAEPPRSPEEKFPARGWAIGMALALLIAAALIFLAKRTTQRRERSARGQERLRDFISKCRERGYDDEEIRKALLEHGWDKDLVERGLRK